MSKRGAEAPLNGTDKKRAVQQQHQEASEGSDDEYMSDSPQQVFDIPVSQNNHWQETITKVVNSVVSIHFSQVICFDTETAICSEATGFVVDAERGLILTNRHVVGPGPFKGYVVFDNHESVDVKPIYRDPIHDFGFLSFDPKAVKYLKLSQLQLCPELAKIGTEIRVVGNDAGEKLSILAGIISRLDRNTPEYGSMTYNDFNTEYIQAAASAAGGSSGSPVVNEDGKCVALQAGGSTEAATDFFLPVYRPLRALQCIQQDKPITRGDIQVEWQLKPFNECVRLGLTAEAEAKARELFPDKIGLLVAELVLPEGPADGLIKEGDTLISIKGEDISTFIRVDEILDENVGNELEFVIQRGGHTLTQKIKIGNLHDITPNRFVSVTGATFNDMSYQIARCFCLPVRGVFVNNGVGSFEFSTQDTLGWLIEAVDDVPVANLDEFVEVMKNVPDKAKIAVQYKHVTDIHSDYVHTIHIDRHWNSTFKMATRNDTTGLWDFKSIQDKALPPIAPEPQNAKYIDIPFDGESKKGCSELVRSFVEVRTICPTTIDSHPFKKSKSHGVVIDAENGFVLVSRRIVPNDMCDIFLVFAESIDVEAKVVFLHPHLNYAIVKYDPKLVLADVKTPAFGDKPLQRGDKAFFVGYNYHLRLVTDDVRVSAVSSRNMSPNPMAPRYKATNLECVILDSKITHECSSGVIADDDGTVRAFWLSYLGEANDRFLRMGLDVTDIKDVLTQLQQNNAVKNLRILDAEFSPSTVFQSRSRGVSQEWIDKYEKDSTDEIKFLTVTRVAAPRLDGVASPLKTGDIVLSVDGELVKNMRDFKPMYTKDVLEFRIVRQKKEMSLQVPTIDTSELETSHVVFWSGVSLQNPHFGVRQLMKAIPSEVYVVEKAAGSPGSQYGLAPVSFITHVNDQETKNLDAFVRVVKDIPDNTYVKLRMVSFDNVPIAISLKTDYHYFPTVEVKKSEETNEWHETVHNESK